MEWIYIELLFTLYHSSFSSFVDFSGCNKKITIDTMRYKIEKYKNVLPTTLKLNVFIRFMGSKTSLYLQRGWNNELHLYFCRTRYSIKRKHECWKSFTLSKSFMTIPRQRKSLIAEKYDILKCFLAAFDVSWVSESTRNKIVFERNRAVV